MQKIFLLSIIFISWSLNRLAQPGQLDYSFGNKGIMTSFPNGIVSMGKLPFKKMGNLSLLVATAKRILLSVILPTEGLIVLRVACVRLSF